MPHFYPATNYGGPVISSFKTCKELAKLGHNVSVSTSNVNQNGKLDVKLNTRIKISDNFHVKYYNETIKNRFSLPLTLGVFRDIKNSDVVHIQYVFNYSTVVALLYSFILRKKTILSPRGCLGKWCLEHGSRLKIFWNKFLIKPLTKKTIWHATSKQECDDIINQFGNVKVIISPNGIDLEEYKDITPISKKEFISRYIPNYSRNDYNKLVVSLGRIQKKKGLDILIKSFTNLLSDFPESILVIAGPDEGEKENLFDLIAKNKMQDNIFIIDSIYGRDKLLFLNAADVFALPSHNENFGNVYLESLAAGTPILASIYTPWSIVEQFECGQWVNNDEVSVTNALKLLFEGDTYHLQKNSLKCAQNYSWKNTAEIISTALDNLK